MTTPRAALTSDDIPPGPLSEDDLRRGWNQQADEHNQWESLDSCEQLAWAQARAIAADRARTALKAEPDGEGLNAADLLPVEPPKISTTMAMQYRSAWREGVEDGWSEARAVLARWGHPHAAAPAPGENLATPPAPEPGEVGELVELLKIAGRWATSTGVHLDRFAALFDHQEAELDALRGVPVAELDDQHRAAIHQAVAEALGSGAYDCTRVWGAWQVGTMGEDDFVLVAEDSDRVAEIADAAIEAIRAIPLPAPQREIASSPTPTEVCDPNCMARWPECEVGGYDPRCCRFPKSCSCWVTPAPQAGEGEA
jgi:hypothetical protein